MNYGHDVVAMHLTHWTDGKSVMFQLWTSSSTILFRNDSYLTGVFPLIAIQKKHNVSRQTLSRSKATVA